TLISRRQVLTLSDIDLTETSCTCKECQGMCEHVPCWPTPQEAEKLMNAGFGDRLMLDWWNGFGWRDNDRYFGPTRIWVLCPASEGHARNLAPERNPFDSRYAERCTFLTEDGLCQLHNLKLKPLEGRIAHHSHADDGINPREAIANEWDTPFGEAL